MLSRYRSMGIIIAILAVSGLANAQEIAPANSGVSIHKVTIDNGGVSTVKYYVSGGSPQLQALVRSVEWAENELTIVEQLQGLKLDTVVNERRIAAVRTAQMTNPLFSRPIARGYGGNGASYLQRDLSAQLASEATPEAAQQLIGYLEQLQVQLDAELKALPPKEKKAAQDAVDGLRPRLAALPHHDAAQPRPQPIAHAAPAVSPPKTPVAASRVTFPVQAPPKQLPMPMDPVALSQMIQQQYQIVQQQLTQSR